MHEFFSTGYSKLNDKIDPKPRKNKKNDFWAYIFGTNPKRLFLAIGHLKTKREITVSNYSVAINSYQDSMPIFIVFHNPLNNIE